MNIGCLAKDLSKAQATFEQCRFVESKLIPKIANIMHKQRGTNQNTKLSVLERFFVKIAYGTSDCWYWRGAINYLGYGLFSTGKAHRVSWELFNGNIPSGLSVCHTCDVRNCVNPKHLFLGTQLDNMRDAKTKGRIKGPASLVGSANGWSKLTEKEVISIRADYAGGRYSNRQLADKYHISRANIGRIVKRQLWKHI